MMPGGGGGIDHYHRLQLSHKGLSIASLNVNRIVGHRNELKHLLVNTGFHVLALNEIQVENDVPDQIIDIDGYKIERKDRTSRGSGITIYLRDYLSHTVRRDMVDYGLEIICVELKPLKYRPFTIVAWYRPPSDPVIFFDLLEKVLSSLDREEKETILIGNTNCDFSDKAIDSDYNCMHLSNVYDLFSFKQVIQEPTWENLWSKTIIDHIATNF